MRLAILGTIGRKLTFCKIWENVFLRWDDKQERKGMNKTKSFELTWIYDKKCEICIKYYDRNSTKSTKTQ